MCFQAIRTCAFSCIFHHKIWKFHGPPWASKGNAFSLDFEMWHFAINSLVGKYFALTFGVGKFKFHYCWPPTKKYFCPPLEKSTTAPMEKILPTPMRPARDISHFMPPVMINRFPTPARQAGSFEGGNTFPITTCLFAHCATNYAHHIQSRANLQSWERNNLLFRALITDALPRKPSWNLVMSCYACEHQSC